jgi:hypothetical protein
MTEAIIVIDVPESASPEDASRALNAPGESYFLVHVLPIYGGHRAYLRRYKQTPTKAETAKTNGDLLDDVTALSVLRANRDKPIRTIESLLAKAGIKRGRRWVCDQLDATCAEDGKEDQALKYIRQCCGPGYTDREVVDELRSVMKIRRSVGWVRRIREQLEKPVPA